MPVGRIRSSLPTVGRIRLGYRAVGSTGKVRPERSETLIFTSGSKGTLLRLAEHVGGTVEAWPDGQEPWRLVSERDSLSVQVPPQMMHEPRYELWSAAGLLRRCDGETCEIATETPDGAVMLSDSCRCTAEHMECKLTTRVVVVIPQAPGLGVWVCTSRSEIAGREIAGQLRLLEMMGEPTLVPATIAIEWDQVRPKGRPTKVPVIRLRFHQGMSSLSGSTAPAIGAGSVDGAEK